jgi:hypothetical protein
VDDLVLDAAPRIASPILRPLAIRRLGARLPRRILDRRAPGLGRDADAEVPLGEGQLAGEGYQLLQAEAGAAGAAAQALPRGAADPVGDGAALDAADAAHLDLVARAAERLAGVGAVAQEVAAARIAAGAPELAAGGAGLEEGGCRGAKGQECLEEDEEDGGGEHCELV